jgi:hypothetical protein
MTREWSGLSPEIRNCRMMGDGQRDRCYLELLAVGTFKAGLNYGVVNAKWDAIGKAFHAFEPRAVAGISDGEISEMVDDPALIRSRRKIESVVEDAREVLKLEADYGGVAEWLDSMPDAETRIAGLHRHFGFMGPSTAYYFLHYAGEDVPGWHEWAEKHPEIMGRHRRQPVHT